MLGETRSPTREHSRNTSTSSGQRPSQITFRNQLHAGGRVVKSPPHTRAEAELIAVRKAVANGLELGLSLHTVIARAGRYNPAKVAVLVAEAATLAARLGKPPSPERSDERGIDDLNRRILYALSELSNGTAGAARIASAAQIPSGQALERLHGLAHEGFVRATGAAGWTITAAARTYMRPRST